MQKVIFKQLDESCLVEMLQVEISAYPLPWSKSMLASSLAKDECWGIYVENSLVSYAILSFILDEAHLLNICVHPDHAGKGLGRKLLQHIVHRSIERKAAMVFLEVRTSNQSAISLYYSEGFNEVGVRPNYYPAQGGGKEDALLMTLELSVAVQV